MTAPVSGELRHAPANADAPSGRLAHPIAPADTTVAIPAALPRSIPAVVLDVEVSQPIEALARHGREGFYDAAWLMVRIFDEPVGLVRIPFATGADRLDAPSIARAITEECGDIVASRVRDAGGDADSVLAGAGTDIAAQPAFLAGHDRWIREGPEITVAICTRNRTADLARALDSLRAQSYRQFKILVVDNAPSDDATRNLVLARAKGERIDYTTELRPGLSWARNHALDVVTTPVIAWLDDDEVADRHWLMETAAAYCRHPGAAAVSGAVLPAELRTLPQLWFEEFGGHSKGRGFTPDSFSVHDAGGQSPLYPLPPFGVGANMSFDVRQARAVGGFDNALGAGTLTQGGEDTLMFSQLLLGGATVVYAPASVTRHYHRPDYAGLARQMRGYGIGLTAYYTSLLRSDWTLIGSLIRLVPQAFRDTIRGSEAHAVPDSFPKQLLRAKTLAMARGPWLYLRARRVARRLRAARDE